ncbi:MFS transporter [Promicromonospora citrea]|nr:MFS transporter [Promicromonospora citrea]
MSQTAAPAADRRRWITLAVVGLAQLMVVLDVTVVNIALPSAQADLGFSDGDRQWVLTSYSLAFASLLLLGGRLSDLVGRKRTFVIGLVGFAAASALGGAAPSFALLVAARALQGAFGALLAPTALAVLTTTFTAPRDRARAFGAFGAIASAGGAVGLLLGGALTQAFDWRWNLYINVVIAGIALLGAIPFVPRLERTGPRPRLDVPGTLFASVALLALVYGFASAEGDGWGAPVTWGSLAAFVVLLVAFVARQRRTAHPLLPLSTVLDRTRGAAYLSVLVAGAGMFGLFLFLTYYLQLTLGFTPLGTGLAFLPLTAMLVLAAQLGTNVFLPRFGPKVLVPIGMTVGAAGAVSLAFLDASSTYLDILPGMLAIGLAMGTIMPASMQTATLGVDREFAGVASAMVNTSQQVGGSVGTALLNTIAATAAADYLAGHGPVTADVSTQAAVTSYATAYWWAAGLYLAGAVLSALLFRRRGSLAVPPGTATPPAAGSPAERAPEPMGVG